MFMNNYYTGYESKVTDAMDMYNKLEGYTTPAANDCKDACLKAETKNK